MLVTLSTVVETYILTRTFWLLLPQTLKFSHFQSSRRKYSYKISVRATTMSKDEANVAAVPDEAHASQTIPVKQGFFHHWRAFFHCSIACLGGLQLG